MQTPHLEFTDEGGTAVTSINGRVFADNVEKVVNAWHTFGPIEGPSRLFNYTARFRLWFQASSAVPEVSNYRLSWVHSSQSTIVDVLATRSRFIASLLVFDLVGV